MFAARNVLMTSASGLTQFVYTPSQSGVYLTNKAATWQYMNNNNADGSKNDSQTATGGAGGWVKADLGASKYVNKIVIGYDYKSNLPGGWGLSSGQEVQISSNNSTWTTVTTTPSYGSTGSTNGLVPITINATCRYVRIYDQYNYFPLLEFEVWGT